MPYHVPMLVLMVVPTFVAVGLGWAYSTSVTISTLITAVDAALFALFVWNYCRLELPRRGRAAARSR